MAKKFHISTSIEGLLRNYKRKKITFIIGDDGKRLSDKEARKALQRELAQGHKLIKSSDECVGFCPINGCPGHDIEEKVVYE